MKFKVKGLVFVGFAAAILSANAMAADNTVTSKSYVDAKISAENTISASSTTTAPNEAAVSTALAAKQDIQNTTDYKVGQNGSWAAMTSAVTEATGGYVDVTAGTNGAAVLNLDSAKMTTTLPATGLDSASTNLVTEGVIKQAIANASQVTNFISQNVGTATDKAPSENAVNQYVTLKGVKVDGTALAIDASDKTVDLGAAAGKGADTDFTTPTNNNVPTTAAVADYVGTQLTNNQADWAETITTDPSYINNKPTQLSQFTDNIDAANAIDSITVGGTEVAPDSNKAVALGAAAGKGADTTITSSASDNNVPTSKAVYDYVDGLPAADIPAMPTQATDSDGYCDASHPCALVTDETTGNPVWKRIAQQGD